MKKSYEKPAIIHTEKIEARAMSCAKSGDSCANLGPLQS
jgi:hypothetical protein